MRLSRIVADLYAVSRRAAKELITDGKVRVEGKRVVKDIEIERGADILAEVNYHIPEFNIDDYIISKNDESIFLYKPPFMHSERIRPEEELTISDIINKEFTGFKLLSRLDSEADGVIGAVNGNIKDVQTSKKYYAFVFGDFPDHLEMDFVINASKKRSVRVTKERGGNMTKFTLLDSERGYCLIEAELEKASRHQVRAFLASQGFPIIGDKIYGGMPFDRLMLHCHSYTINGRQEKSNREDDFIDYLKSRI